ncbi:MAG: AAA family ATPase [Ardenticatenales bacterium]|nr:AAA family ATPase [Ardenticatenales bacterium]
MNEREQLEQAIAALEAQRAMLGDAVVDAALGSMRATLATLQQERAPEQRKHATILFADLAGFTPMSERLDPEEVRAITSRHFHEVTPAIRRHGGRIEKYIGDAVMAVFGIPTAHEHDPEHAIRAALEMQQALAALNDEMEPEWGLRLAMRIGIHTGLVVVGYLGEDFTVVGDTVNLASRLEGAAPVGGVLISHDTYRHVRGLFDVEPLEPIRVKGKAEPVQVYVVQRAKPRAFHLRTRGVEGIETRMVGRAAELLHLQQALRAVRAGHMCQALTVIGEAGVGKSRLLYEFRSWVELTPDELWLFKGRTAPEMTRLPYALLRDMLAFRFQIQDSDLAEVARAKLVQGLLDFLSDEPEAEMKAHFIGQLLGFDFSASPHLRGMVADTKQLRDRARYYLSRVFTRASEQAPLLLLLEDLHWADDASLDTLAYLVQECRALPLLLVATARHTLLERRPDWGEGQPYAGHHRLHLAPLPTQETHQLVDEVLQKLPEIPPALRALIVERAEGNPFYVEELVKMLIEERVILPGTDGWQADPARLADVRVPPTLTGVLQARLEALPADERALLQQASVVGRVFWDSAVSYLAEQEEAQVHQTLMHLRQRELLYQHEVSTFAGAREYLFKHALLRDVTYESLLKPQRRLYHARAADWLNAQGRAQAEQYAGLLAQHYEQAGERAQAAPWYRLAAERARAAYANLAALDYYQQLLPLLAEPQQIDILLKQGMVLEVIGEWHHAEESYRQALHLIRQSGSDSPPLVEEAHCQQMLGSFFYFRWRYQEALECFEQARHGYALLGDQVRLSRALDSLGGLWLWQGEYALAQALCEESLALRRTLGEQAGMSDSLLNLGAIAYFQGNPTMAWTLYQESLALLRQIGEKRKIARLLRYIFKIPYEAGDYDVARTIAAESVALSRKIGDKRCLAIASGYLGLAMIQQGESGLGWSTLEEGALIARELADPWLLAEVLGSQGLGAYTLGQHEAAERAITESLHLLQEKVPVRWHSARLLLCAALVAAARGEPRLGWERGQESLRLAMELDIKSGLAYSLIALAGFLQTPGAALRLLAGAMEQLRGAAAPLLPELVPVRERIIQAARAEMNPAPFAATWAEGISRPLPQLIADARLCPP